MECEIIIGDTHSQEGTRHRRMVSLDNLPPSCCLNSNEIAIDITHEGVKRSFKRVGTAARKQRYSSSKSAGSSRSSYTYWAGEDTSDGSIFNYVQNDNGNIVGSMVDLRNHNVLQFHYQNGTYTATITASKDFPRENHPVKSADFDSSVFTRKLYNQESLSNVAHPPMNKFVTRTSNSSSTADSLHSSAQRKLYDDSGGNLDVMVVWTKAAECKAFGLTKWCDVSAASKNNMQALVDLAIEETNAAYAASGVDTELLLVHSKRHNTYVEQSFLGSSLGDLKYNRVPGVHEDREKYGADIVVLLVESTWCGVAYHGPGIDEMFSLVDWKCATGYYTFAHEIGEYSCYRIITQ